MIVHSASNARPLVIALFLAISFGTGLVLVTATRTNTEDRSKASGNVYACDAVCSPAAGGIGSMGCQTCMQQQNSQLAAGTRCSDDVRAPDPVSCDNCSGGRQNAAFDPIDNRVECLPPAGSTPVPLKDGDSCSSDAVPTDPFSCHKCPGGDENAAFNPNTGRVECGAIDEFNAAQNADTDRNPWGDCAQWGADGECNFTYWQKAEAAETDWRCKPNFSYLGLCEYSTGPQEMPSAPRPESDPGLNPGEETF